MNSEAHRSERHSTRAKQELNPRSLRKAHRSLLPPQVLSEMISRPSLTPDDSLLLVVVVVYSYRSRASNISPEEILQRALVVRGPDRVDVLNATNDHGVWLMVHGRVGLDAGNVSGVNRVEGDGILQDVWKSIGRWGIRQLDRVSVDLSTIDVCSRQRPSEILARISTVPLEIPVTANPPRDVTWLTPIALPVLIQPTKNISSLMRFVRDSWKDGTINVQAAVGRALVHGGGLKDEGWRRMFSVSHRDIHTMIQIKIPTLPGLPVPGHNSPFPVFSDLVTLQSFEIVSEYDSLSIRANATVIDPVPLEFEFTMPSMPFFVSLPTPNHTSVEVAFVHTQPFTLTHPNISLAVDGAVLPLSRNASGALSTFAGNYSSGLDSDITISTPLLPDLTIEAKFPGPNPKPRILRNVTIRDMRIKPTSGPMVASGTVVARVVLPKGIHVGVNVTRVFPDVLVFDGEVPGPDDPPITPRAFAHIRPEDWLPAECEPAESEDGEGTAVAVSARIVDVPLEVLPGREREFSNFVIFGSQGALAGVQGIAAVAVHVHGLPFANGHDGEMELTGLPFQGSVRIGKRSMLDLD
ncbi:hypothetical protein A0H81_02995 [Grifola frondosa]|uniref:Uncharacterized protein n=1 Tax=Grifola frondosa TaxID=5627 RepID=A0A1C7MHR5_GRIFR|nr:hypothetical protein A0H81_02995 [Grifola frondosa]